MDRDRDTRQPASPPAGDDRRDRLQPPLTPMIDVTFQLLLYFLLTTEFRRDEGQIPGSLPPVGGIRDRARIRPNLVEIVLTGTGTWRESCRYEIAGRPPVDGAAALRRTLAGVKQQAGAESAVVIRTRGAVRWRYAVEAFNAAVHGGFRKIGFR